MKRIHGVDRIVESGEAGERGILEIVVEGEKENRLSSQSVAGRSRGRRTNLEDLNVGIVGSYGESFDKCTPLLK